MATYVDSGDFVDLTGKNTIGNDTSSWLRFKARIKAEPNSNKTSYKVSIGIFMDTKDMDYSGGQYTASVQLQSYKTKNGNAQQTKTVTGIDGANKGDFKSIHWRYSGDNVNNQNNIWYSESTAGQALTNSDITWLYVGSIGDYATKYIGVPEITITLDGNGIKCINDSAAAGYYVYMRTFSGSIPADKVMDLSTIPLISPPVLDDLENGNKYNNPHPSSGGVKNGVSADENTIRINWKATSNGGAPITKVSVYKKKSNGDYETDPIKTATSSGFAVNTVQHIDIGSLTNGTSYTFKVVLKNEAGNSNEKTITIRTKYQAPTLNFYANGCGYNSISCRIYTRTERGTGNGFPIDHAELSIYTRQDQAAGSKVDTDTFSFTPPSNSQTDFTVTLKNSQEAKALSPGTTYYVYCKIYSTVAYDYVSSDNEYIANDYTHRPYQAITYAVPSGLTVYDKETSGTPIFNKELL